MKSSAINASRTALLLIDVINELNFPGHEQLLPRAIEMAQRLRSFCERARAAGAPIIYVNDNFGRWRSDLQHQVHHCLKGDNPGRAMVELLVPQKSDYFILKPKHSGFYSTSLDLLLNDLHVSIR